MDLSVNYTQCDSRDAAFSAAKAQITPEYISKFKVKADIDYRPEVGIIEATGKGFTLTLEFKDSKVDVFIKLSFMLKAFRGKILEAMERKLKKNL